MLRAMARALVAAVMLISLTASAARASPAARVKRHRWRCHFVGRMVVCDVPERPLRAPPRKDRVTLLERTPPEFSPLVTPPTSFR